MKNKNRIVKAALGSLTQDLIDAGMGSPFSEKELNYYGVKIPKLSDISYKKIKKIREKVHLSQSVFARLLNVSAASIKQWEQGTRTPTGATQVLLDLLDKEPHLLDYRMHKPKNRSAA